MSDERLETYFYHDEEFGWIIGGTAEECAQTLTMYIAELGDGEEIALRVKRLDMTQAEIDALPEQ